MGDGLLIPLQLTCSSSSSAFLRIAIISSAEYFGPVCHSTCISSPSPDQLLRYRNMHAHEESHRSVK